MEIRMLFHVLNMGSAFINIGDLILMAIFFFLGWISHAIVATVGED